MASDQIYDVAVVGCGMGGWVGVAAARKRGARVALIESGPIGAPESRGGVSPRRLWSGPPRSHHDARQAADFGIDVSDVTVDFAK